MPKEALIGVIIAIIFLGGGLAGGYVKGEQTTCTQKACECILGQIKEGQLQFQPVAAGEIPCNECGVEDQVFFTGLMNVAKNCAGKEMIQCRNGKQVKSRVEIEEGSCKYNFAFFSF